MRYILRLTYVLLTTLVAFRVNAEITFQKDRYTGVETFERTPEVNYKRPTMQLTAVMGGDVAVVGFELAILSKSWRYMECNKTNWLLDGKPYNLEGGQHQGNVATGFVLERIVWNLPQTANSSGPLGDIARAKSVEYRICNDEYKLTAAELADLRSYIKKSQEYFSKKKAKK